MSAKEQGKRRGRPPGPGGPGARDARAQGAGHLAGHPTGHPAPPATPPPAAGRPPEPPESIPPEAASPGDVPDDRRIRKNGTSVPLVVQKLAAIVDYKGIRRVALESPEGADIGENRLYHWRHKAGQPSIEAILRLANYLDVPLEYLIDDNVPVATPPPPRWETGTYRVLDSAAALGLTVEDVERYLMAVKLAITLKVDPERCVMLIATGAVERRDHLGGESRGTGGTGGGPSGGPKWGPNTPTVDRQDDGMGDRRNGGPRPQTG